MNNEEKKSLQRLKALEAEEVKKKAISNLIEVQQVASSCVFHYTTAGALIGMLKNTTKENAYLTFWASHISYMNDKEERKYGVDKMWEVLKDVENDLSIPKVKRITELDRDELNKFVKIKSLERKSLVNVYSVSFSKTFDTLPMWKMYGQDCNGICLGFDLKSINEYLKSRNMDTLDGIVYGIGESISDSQMNNEELERWKEYVKYMYQQTMTFIEQNSNQIKIIDENSNIALYNYFALYNIIPCKIKNPSYKYEDEYRLICREFNNKELYFRERKGLLFPYVEVDLPLDALKIIAVGPTIDKERQLWSVAKLLTERGKDISSLIFWGSDIPYYSV